MVSPTIRLGVLNSGDHRFIKHPSYVVYAEAIIWRVDNMVRKQRSGEISVHDDMPEATFNRILDGFDISDEVTPKNLKFKINIAYHLLMMSKQQEFFGIASGVFYGRSKSNQATG